MLSKLEILRDNQFGFRKNHSTSLALIDLYEKVSLALDHNEHALSVFLALSKVFDTIDYNILLDKLTKKKEKKKDFMPFRSTRKRYHFPMEICINKQRIEPVKGTVFLGVVLEERLAWNPHISEVPCKISRSIGVINRARFFLPKPCLQTV